MKNVIMSVLGFIVLSFLALGATDYITQSTMAGKSPGQFTVGDWAESFAQRGREAAMRAERELRRDKPMRDYLPPAPAGWTEVEWTPEYQAVMKGQPAPVPSEFQEMQQEIEKHPVFLLDKAVGMAKGKVRNAKKAKARRVFVRGDKVLIVHAQFKDTRTNSGIFGMLTMDSHEGRTRGQIEMVHRGVSFRNITSRKAPEGVIRLKGEIADEIEIYIDAAATKSDIAQVVARLNVEDLRALTDSPNMSPSKSHTEAVAEMRRQKHLERQKELEMQARADRKLNRMMTWAKQNGQNEVCTTINGKRYCRWVE